MEVGMSGTVKVRPLGNSMGVIIPREILARHRVSAGDTLHVVDTPDGFRVVKHDPTFGQQMEAARKIMRRRHAVLHELAK